MKRDPLRLLVHAGYLGSIVPNTLAFERALGRPEETQRRKLRALLRAQEDTAFGREHGFRHVDDVAAFQRRVPVRDYAEHAPWVDRIARGETNVLTSEPVRMLERTSGSTAGDKWIPFTAGLLAELSAATSPWISSVHRRHPGLLGTTSYWSVSPAAREPERTEGGLRVGFEDDSEYFGPLTRWALARMFAVPGDVARIRDVDAWRRTTLDLLLRARTLGLVSVWNPSFLTLLMEALERELDGYLARLPAARANEIRRALDRTGRLTGEALWPSLRVVSCWTDASAASFVPGLRAYFPHVTIEPKGLLATEGVVSIPYSGGNDGAELAVASHFLEFLDLDAPSARPRLAHQLVTGASYSPLLTTAGGLYRYHLKDVVTVTGRTRGTPRVRFEGKADRSSDLCGEKLTEPQVSSALSDAAQELGVELAFALVAPLVTPRPRYALFVESNADDARLDELARALDERLSRAQHYAYCRDLGQLDALRAVRVRDGQRRFQEALARTSARLGDIKPARLDKRTQWMDWLSP